MTRFEKNLNGGGGIGMTGGLGSLGMSGGQGLSLGAVSQPSLVGGSTVSGLNLAGTTQPFNLNLLWEREE